MGGRSPPARPRLGDATFPFAAPPLKSRGASTAPALSLIVLLGRAGGRFRLSVPHGGGHQNDAGDGRALSPMSLLSMDRPLPRLVQRRGPPRSRHASPACGRQKPPLARLSAAASTMSAGIHGREVAQREAMEEAGVLGAARIVGLWNYKSRSYVTGPTSASSSCGPEMASTSSATPTSPRGSSSTHGANQISLLGSTKRVGR